MTSYEEPVSVSNHMAKLFKRADGRIVKRVYLPDGLNCTGRVGWDAPRWAQEAYLQVPGGYHSKLVRVLRRAQKNVNVRDALIAAIEARLVVAFIKAQTVKP